MSGRLLGGALLVAVYALTLASAEPWDLAMGTAAAAGSMVGARRFLGGGVGGATTGAAGLIRRVLALGPFLVAVGMDVLRGTWSVALVVLHLRPLRRPGIVRVPIGERTPLGVAVSGLVATLSPGEFLVDIDWEDRTMLIHVLDATDPDRVREVHERFYWRYQRAVFP